MGGSDKTFKMKQLTTYLIVKLGLVKPKERKLPVNPDKDGFCSGILSGPGKSSSLNGLLSFLPNVRLKARVFIGRPTVSRFSRNKSLLISFGAPVAKLMTNVTVSNVK